MDISVTCKLLDKQLHSVDGLLIDVYGLAELSAIPRKIGLGSNMLHALEGIAKFAGKVAVVGFADMDVVEFYRHCGWYVYELPYIKKHMVSSHVLPKCRVNPGEDW